MLEELDAFEAEEPESRPRKRHRTRNTWLAILGGLLAVVVAVVAVGWFLMHSKIQQIERIENAFPEETTRPTQHVNDDGKSGINFLLVGTDSRDETAPESLLEGIGDRSDTIMVVHIPADRSGIQVMSIMRDSWVEIPGHGMGKVNAALAYGGMPLLVQTVEGILDSRIDHVAVIGFEGFKSMTEALGGVTVNNPEAFSGKNYEFPAGEITLEGNEALEYVRTRKAFSDGDYSRVANQQRFMKALLSTSLSRGTLSNPGRVLDLADAVTNHLATDSGVDQGFILGLAPELSGLKGSDVTTFTMPTYGTGMEGGQSVVYLDTDRLPELRKAFKEDTLAEFAAKV